MKYPLIALKSKWESLFYTGFYCSLKVLLIICVLACGNVKGYEKGAYFAEDISSKSTVGDTISKVQADSLYKLFKTTPPFKWHAKYATNNCEDRANAICILLDRWGLKNDKVWLLGSSFKVCAEEKDTLIIKGKLVNKWAYHVAAVFYVKDSNNAIPYVIDPATCDSIMTAAQWAEKNMQTDSGVYVFTPGSKYMYGEKPYVTRKNWQLRSVKNFTETMEGVAGYNGRKAWVRNTMFLHKRKIYKVADMIFYFPKPAFL